MTYPSHVAILVPSVRRAADYLAKLGFDIGPEEEFEGEGTREIYVEGAQGNSLLLLEPAKPGAYQRAMDRRGPGLHHLAIDVLNLDEFIVGLSGTGWLLHPRSVKTMAQSRTAYLARPGFPALIEVQERKTLGNKTPFVEGITVIMDPAALRLLAPLGLQNMVHIGPQSTVQLAGKAIPLQALY